MADKQDDTSGTGGAAGGNSGGERTFTQAEFDSALGKAVEKKIGQRERQIRETAVREAFAGLDIDDATPDALKERLKAARGTETELEKTQTDLKQLARENKKLLEKVTSLDGFRQTSLKRGALATFAPKVADLDIVTNLLEAKLTINEKDEVLGPDGKSVEDTVAALLEAKPLLRASGYKAGAGTGANPKKEPASPDPKNGEKPKTMAERRAGFLAALTQDGSGSPHP